MNKVSLCKVENARDYLKISELAHIIWREHYSAILSPQQIEYMLEKFQTPEAMQKAAADGYGYYIIKRLGVPIGYIGLKLNEPQGKLFLSKLYILSDYRGNGYARDALMQLEDMCRKNRLCAIWLTVNKYNPSYEAYKKMGFNTIKEAVTDIGGGFVMDDYIMEKEV